MGKNVSKKFTGNDKTITEIVGTIVRNDTVICGELGFGNTEFFDEIYSAYTLNK